MVQGYLSIAVLEVPKGLSFILVTSITALIKILLRVRILEIALGELGSWQWTIRLKNAA